MKLAIGLSALCLLLTGCQAYKDAIPEIYKPTVTQGKILDQSQINQLRPCMSQEQVVSILGAPSIADPLHANRWDYVYLRYPNQDKSRAEEKRLTLYFDDNGLLARREKIGW